MSDGESINHRILPFGVAVFVIGIALIVLGVYWARYAGGGIFSILIFFAGIFLSVHQVGLERGGHQRLWVSRTIDVQQIEKGGHPSQFDTDVLNNTNDLIRKLGIQGFQVDRVVWGPATINFANVASSECHFHRHDLVLSSRLKNLLMPGEWTPLIAVSLVYEKKLMPRIFRRRQVAVLLPWILGLAGLLVLMSLPGDSIVAIPIIVWLILPIVIAIRRFWRTDLQMRLKANTEAAAFLGGERLASVLVKIGETIPEIVRTNQRSAEFPTIASRLDQIQPQETGYANPNLRKVHRTLQIEESQRKAGARIGGWRRHKRLVFATLFLLCIIAPVTAFLVWDNSVCPPATILSAGTQTLVGPRGHSDYPFLVQNVVWSARPISGAFTSNRPVSLYIMTVNDYMNFTRTGIIGSYLFNSGQVTSGTYECGGQGCPPQPFAHQGQEYIVIYNSDSQSSVTVTIAQDFVLQSC